MTKRIPEDDFGHVYDVTPLVDTTLKISDHVVITASGVVYQGPDIELSNGVFIKALPTNGGYIYLGDSGNNTISTSTGFPLSAGEAIILQIGNLNEIYFVGTSSGDRVAWLKA